MYICRLYAATNWSKCVLWVLKIPLIDGDNYNPSYLSCCWISSSICVAVFFLFPQRPRGSSSRSQFSPVHLSVWFLGHGCFCPRVGQAMALPLQHLWLALLRRRSWLSVSLSALIKASPPHAFPLRPGVALHNNVKVFPAPAAGVIDGLANVPFGMKRQLWHGGWMSFEAG